MLMPKMTKCIGPKQIVERACQGIMEFQQLSKQQDEDAAATLSAPKITSQISLAIDAVDKKHVSLVDVGSWLIKSTDGSKSLLYHLLQRRHVPVPKRSYAIT